MNQQNAKALAETCVQNTLDILLDSSARTASIEAAMSDMKMNVIRCPQC